jgi:hypothetical protein
VAPFLLLPNAARTRTLYVATGHPRYENLAFREGLGAACADTGVQLVTHTTRSWKEMWMQDTMEVGYTQLPGRPPMHVVLGGLRGADTFPPRLLGRDTGFLQVGRNRGIADGVDDWADWMGNMEVTPPVPGYPLGRVFYGRNTDTGVGLHPDVVAFLEAQRVQAPFWLDTGFLTIKHVDEIATFLPGAEGRPLLLIADTRRAVELVPAEAGPSNTRNQARLDKVLGGGTYADGTRSRGLLAELGLTSDQVVRLPVSYDGGHWSLQLGNTFGADSVSARLALICYDLFDPANPAAFKALFMQMLNGVFLWNYWDGVNDIPFLSLSPSVAAFPQPITSGGVAVCLTNDARLTDARDPKTNSVGTSALQDGCVTSAKLDAGVLSSMTQANGLIVLHHQQATVQAGELVDVMMFDGAI